MKRVLFSIFLILIFLSGCVSYSKMSNSNYFIIQPFEVKNVHFEIINESERQMDIFNEGSYKELIVLVKIENKNGVNITYDFIFARVEDGKEISEPISYRGDTFSKGRPFGVLKPGEIKYEELSITFALNQSLDKRSLYLTNIEVVNN